MGHELTALSFGSLTLLAYWTVLLSELVADKSIYTVGSLILRFRPVIVLAAAIVAFAGKMFAAVLLGKVVIQLNSRWTDLVSAFAFFLSAMLIWFEGHETSTDEAEADVSWSRGALVSFGSLFFTEWADPGQISAVALTLKSHSLLAVWLGGTLAMISKGGLAVALGVKLRDRLPQRKLRTLASASCSILGVITVGEIVLR